MNISYNYNYNYDNNCCFIQFLKEEQSPLKDPLQNQ